MAAQPDASEAAPTQAHSTSRTATRATSSGTQSNEISLTFFSNCGPSCFTPWTTYTAYAPMSIMM